MIQVIEKPDATLLDSLKQYLQRAAPGSGVCGEHDPRWLEVLREGLGHRPFVLIAKKSNGEGQSPGDICGYLPLALVVSRLFGRFLVSLPYVNRAGVVADDAQTAAQLVERAAQLAREQDVQYLELRHDHDPETTLTDHLEHHQSLNASLNSKYRMVLTLPATPDDLWKSLDAKVRNQVRKGDKSGLTIRWGGLELLLDFYEIFAVNMRDLGTPVYPARLFKSILQRFPGEAELAVVGHEGRPVAAAMLVHSGPSTQVPSASCLRRANPLNANMWMYHRLLLHAIERGSKEFDFGRSSEDSGTYRFKKQWGAQPRPTLWQYHIRHGDISRMRPDSAHNRWRVEVWKKLPVWLTRCIGPAIVRGIP